MIIEQDTRQGNSKELFQTYVGKRKKSFISFFIYIKIQIKDLIEISMSHTKDCNRQ